MSLDEYRAKRDFLKTAEPEGGDEGAHRRPIFVVQEHHASHLHYDFRLEAEGVLKSWAVPKEPTLDPSQKRLAVQVEDHPLGYERFEGTIPQGQYGGGTVAIWDRGTYEPATDDASGPRTVTQGIEAGRLDFVMHGERLRGRFSLVRMKASGRGNGKLQWLLIKKKDDFARAEEGATKPVVRTKAARPSARATRTARPPKEGVVVTHPERVIFPDLGLTKGDVFAYYGRIADRLLPFLKDRPITLERLPEGLAVEGAPHFWQKDTPASYPDWIPRVELPSERGKAVHYALVNDVETLLYLVNQGTLTFHAWASRVGALDRPDFVLFDLDPGEASFPDVVAVARALRTSLKEEGEKLFVKTSGKTGLHVLLPWTEEGDHDRARAWALGVAERVVEVMPERATVEVRKVKRGARVFIDVLQNARGHHAVPPYVVRAVPGATISTPLDWKELAGDLDPSSFRIETIFRRLAHQKRDPMAGLVRGFARPESPARRESER